MAGLKFAIWCLLLFTAAASRAGDLKIRFEKSKDVVVLTNGAKVVEVPRALLLNHLMDSLRLYDWHYDNRSEAKKFETFPNPLGLTIKKAVERRFESQHRRLLSTVAFFKLRALEGEPEKRLRTIQSNLEKLNSSFEAGASIRPINEALFRLLQEFVTTQSTATLKSQDSAPLLILESYLRSLPDLGFVASKALPEFMKAGVTQAQWFEVMGTNPAFFALKTDCPAEHRITRGVAMCPSRPVETMSIHQVYNFVDKLRWQDPKFLYALPSLAERKSVTGIPKADSGWFIENAGMQTHAAGTKPANEFGLFDLYGNLWEIARDDDVATAAIGRARPALKFTIAGGSWIDRFHQTFDRPEPRLLASWTCYDVGFRVVRRPAK